MNKASDSLPDNEDKPALEEVSVGNCETLVRSEPSKQVATKKRNPIPKLNEFGLLPPGIYDCALDDIRDRYATHGRRTQLWQPFLRFIEDIKRHKVTTIYVDGSYITDKKVPNDIDVAVVIPDGKWDEIEYLFNDDSGKKFMEKYLVEVMPATNIMGKRFQVYCQFCKQEEILERGLPSPDFPKGVLRVRIA